MMPKEDRKRGRPSLDEQEANLESRPKPSRQEVVPRRDLIFDHVDHLPTFDEKKILLDVKKRLQQKNQLILFKVQCTLMSCKKSQLFSRFSQ